MFYVMIRRAELYKNGLLIERFSQHKGVIHTVNLNRNKTDIEWYKEGHMVHMFKVVISKHK